MTSSIKFTNITSQSYVLPEMPSKFAAVVYISHRARAIASGSPTLAEDFEKPAELPILAACEEMVQKKWTIQALMNSLSDAAQKEEMEQIQAANNKALSTQELALDIALEEEYGDEEYLEEESPEPEPKNELAEEEDEDDF